MTRPTRAAAALVAALLTMALAMPAMAAHTIEDSAAGVVAAVVHVEDSLNDLDALNDLTIQDVHIIEVNDSLNNVLQNARFLNNIDVLRDALDNLLANPNCSVIAVCDSINNTLNNNNILVSDVVAIDVLSGEVNIYVQP
ncbi:MAG: hypothetical protein ACRDVL_12955 [Acidimicrobiia bacterium]